MEANDENEPGEGRKSGLERAVIGLLLLTAYGIALVLIVGGGMIHRKPVEYAPAPVSYEDPPEAMEPAALAVLEAFHEAPDLAAKAAYVHAGARVLPLMRDFHEVRGHPFPTLARVSPGRVAGFDGKPMVLFEVEPFSGPRRFVAVVWDGRRFAVDWESMTCYGTMDWMDFVEGRPAVPQTMRLFIREAADSLHPPGFGEKSAFFHIEHRDHPQPLTAFADEELSADLRSLTEGRRAPVTLELEWRESGSGQPPLPWIKKLVAEGWSR